MDKFTQFLDKTTRNRTTYDSFGVPYLLIGMIFCAFLNLNLTMMTLFPVPVMYFIISLDHNHILESLGALAFLFGNIYLHLSMLSVQIQIMLHGYKFQRKPMN